MIEPLLEAERAMDMGLLDQAERLYRSVADADPRNSIAVVGLSRVALERGEDAKALILARRAAQIDPANPMAARMVARLEEVLAARADARSARSQAPAVEAGVVGSAAVEAAPAADPSTAPAAPTRAVPAADAAASAAVAVGAAPAPETEAAASISMTQLNMPAAEDETAAAPSTPRAGRNPLRRLFRRP